MVGIYRARLDSKLTFTRTDSERERRMDPAQYEFNLNIQSVYAYNALSDRSCSCTSCCACARHWKAAGYAGRHSCRQWFVHDDYLFSVHADRQLRRRSESWSSPFARTHRRVSLNPVYSQHILRSDRCFIEVGVAGGGMMCGQVIDNSGAVS